MNLGKIVNFLSKGNHNKNDLNGNNLIERVGTPQYQSPEQLAGMAYNEKVDIFAIGLILLELCSFFTTLHEKQVTFQLIRENKYKFEYKEEIDQDNDFKYEHSLILKMTKKDPSLRPSANDIINSEEFKCLQKINEPNEVF